MRGEFKPFSAEAQLRSVQSSKIGVQHDFLKRKEGLLMSNFGINSHLTLKEAHVVLIFLVFKCSPSHLQV